MLCKARSLEALKKFTTTLKFQSPRFIHYVQGQEPEPRIREYFYYIDHQGMLFLDDSKMKNFTSCFKEKKFLEFFFKRIRTNNTGRYQEEFPFLSLCGRERNFIRCDDVPIVFTHIIKRDAKDVLTYGYVGEALAFDFVPNKIYMLPDSGRVYHPADDKYGGVGLIRSKLSIELSKNFTFGNGESNPPTNFLWNKKSYELDQLWFHNKVKEHNLKIRDITEH
ncbi:unnamed protein product [Leptosia nina]|uniref:Uncharacterized protein n=1 Tax=Leptosia nina TaxID=320188 RepID=A0AAV1JL46_9NEOP